MIEIGNHTAENLHYFCKKEHRTLNGTYRKVIVQC